ncbi:DUF3231 family protein [Anaerobacillus sp. CMMVII]|uniref:DUF3231 family protein n=1 Tax=Anaerobacillus sp. CMMVII TaxID=2755588 RepID=UPI0021B80919|nr:DUF3231 family protein [Anaerobacillus sp. CMMVII]MCT8136722.1 DUF3231 family protein [Anaerobacillus sp. CMMVII]
MPKENISLTSSEIGSLWTSYMNDSMSKCVLSFMIKHVHDEDIYPVIEQALTLTKAHLEKLTLLFQAENYAIPTGFTESDLNPNAPSLYTDTFCLTYINHMAKVGMLGNSGFLSMSAREDLIDFYTSALVETTKLYNQGTKIALEKGVYVRSPYIPVPQKIDFIDKKNYFSGFSFLNKQRPLNSIEISHLFMNIQTNLIGMKLALSFAQTSPLKAVQEFMIRGSEISQKHVKVFSGTLLDNHIPSPISSDVCITDSTIPPFSDKLMMFHMSLLSATGTGNYALAASASQRSDIVLNYERLSIEIGQYAKTGANIMIENNWLEQPPGTTDKEKLAYHKNS